MAERSADVGARGATRWPSLAIPDAVPDMDAACHARAALEASLLYLHGTHRLASGCQRPDHAAEIRRETERAAESSAHTIVAVIFAVLDGLELPAATVLRGEEIAERELSRLAAGTVT